MGAFSLNPQQDRQARTGLKLREATAQDVMNIETEGKIEFRLQMLQVAFQAVAGLERSLE